MWGLLGILLPYAVSAFESLLGPKNGADKKVAVQQFVGSVVGGMLAVSKGPQLNTWTQVNQLLTMPVATGTDGKPKDIIDVVADQLFPPTTGSIINQQPS